MRYLILFILSISLVGCESEIDQEEVLEIAHTYLGTDVSKSEYVKRAKYLQNKYGNKMRGHYKMLSDESARLIFLSNEQLKADLGGYYLNELIGVNRDENTDLAKWLITQGVNPFEPDYFGVTPVVYAATFGNKKIFDYIIETQGFSAYENVDDKLVDDLIKYEKHVRFD